MSLSVAVRGDKDHLRPLWSGEFDFERACRDHGRNDAFWVLCYRRHLAGLDLPDARERRRLCKAANRATGYRNASGESERYTAYEARATVEQVSGYASGGLGPMVDRLRHWADSSRARSATPPARRLARALADVAERSGRYEFSASTRRLGEMAGMSHVSVSAHMHVLVAAGLVVRKGYCAPWGKHERGTSRFSIMPVRPEQRIDEEEPPRYDKLRARWSWRRPELRGTTTRWAWLKAYGESVPNVKVPTISTTNPCSKEFLQVAIEHGSSRGSP